MIFFPYPVSLWRRNLVLMHRSIHINVFRVLCLCSIHRWVPSAVIFDNEGDTLIQDLLASSDELELLFFMVRRHPLQRSLHLHLLNLLNPRLSSPLLLDLLRTIRNHLKIPHFDAPHIKWRQLHSHYILLTFLRGGKLSPRCRPRPHFITINFTLLRAELFMAKVYGSLPHIFNVIFTCKLVIFPGKSAKVIRVWPLYRKRWV